MDKQILSQTYPFQNIPLTYGFADLEPYIDTKTMMLHHDRHLQTYIDNLNKYLVTKPDLQTLTLGELIVGYPTDEEITHNAGGVYNHEFFFSSMRQGMSQIVIGLSGRLMQMFQRDFGGLEGFKRQFISAAMSVFGSGYAWLCATQQGNLTVIITANQDTPLPQGICPLLCVDVWEHAYYLKHYNARVDYLGDFWNVIDWVKVSNRLDACFA